MTTAMVEDAVPEAKEANPFESMMSRFDRAAKLLDLNPDLYAVMRVPNRELKVYIPVRMDSGRLEIFEGYRVKHNFARGPAKGGIRYSPDVSIDEIMGAAGLTRGGFYKHFSGKEDLYKDAVLEFICAGQPEPWQARYVDPAARGAALSRMIVDAYLSRDHFDDRDGSCPMIALPSDIARSGTIALPSFVWMASSMLGFA